MSGESGKIKIGLCFKREVLREGLARILGAEHNLKVVATYGDGGKCIDKICQQKPDVLVLDTDIYGSSYIDVAKSVIKLLPETKIIILTLSEDEADLVCALKAGARAYLTKDTGVKELIATINGVSIGEVIISSPMAERVLHEFRDYKTIKDTIREKHDLGLSIREEEVLKLASKGQTNKEIADNLFISENTVKVHLSKILDKLHVKNRHQAIARMMN